MNNKQGETVRLDAQSTQTANVSSKSNEASLATLPSSSSTAKKLIKAPLKSTPIEINNSKSNKTAEHQTSTEPRVVSANRKKIQSRVVQIADEKSASKEVNEFASKSSDNGNEKPKQRRRNRNKAKTKNQPNGNEYRGERERGWNYDDDDRAIKSYTNEQKPEVTNNFGKANRPQNDSNKLPYSPSNRPILNETSKNATSLKNKRSNSNDRFKHTVTSGMSRDTYKNKTSRPDKQQQQLQQNQMRQSPIKSSNSLKKDQVDKITLSFSLPASSHLSETIKINEKNKNTNESSILVTSMPTQVTAATSFVETRPPEQLNVDDKIKKSKFDLDMENNYILKVNKRLKQNESGRYRCSICNYVCNTTEIVLKHISGDIHKSNLEVS
jgi:hypothetical protein